MNAEEHERLTRVEIKVEHVERELSAQRQFIGVIDTKLDTIIATLNLSKGAYKALIIVGSVGASAVAGLAWLWGHLIIK
jgi:hypothetical protein